MLCTVATRITVSQIIGHDEYHVWLDFGECNGRSTCGWIGFWLILRHMDGEQEAGNEGRKTACQSRSHGSLVGFRKF